MAISCAYCFWDSINIVCTNRHAASTVVVVVVVGSVVEVVAGTWKSSAVVASVAQLKATVHFS